MFHFVSVAHVHSSVLMGLPLGSIAHIHHCPFHVRIYEPYFLSSTSHIRAASFVVEEIGGSGGRVHHLLVRGWIASPLRQLCRLAFTKQAHPFLSVIPLEG